MHKSDLKTFHRDLKADNILVKTIGDSKNGVPWSLKLIDFG